MSITEIERTMRLDYNFTVENVSASCSLDFKRYIDR
jgi:hypothetical protein